MDSCVISMQLIRFTIVGLCNTLLDWVVFYCLISFSFFDIHEISAKSLSFVVAVTNSFFWNSIWTFREGFLNGIRCSQRHKIITVSRYFVKFLIVSAFGLFANTSIFGLMRHALVSVTSNSTGRLISLALATTVVILINFLANKYWTYGDIN